MVDDVSDIAELYNGNPLEEHSRLERRQLEYDLTWRYLNDYLPSKGRILEVGAATGRYTVELAKRGYTVTAVDLSAGLLELRDSTPGLIVLLLSVPLALTFSDRLTYSMDSFIPKDLESIRAQDIYNTQFPDAAQSQIIIAVKGDPDSPMSKGWMCNGLLMPGVQKEPSARTASAKRVTERPPSADGL